MCELMKATLPSSPPRWPALDRPCAWDSGSAESSFGEVGFHELLENLGS